MSITPSPRLATAVPYVRTGRLLADIGTDHAYLPIHLCEAGILTPVTAGNGARIAAIAADINQGPVDRATEHIAEAGLSDRILPVRTDGLVGLDAYDPTDVIIFGMGGELIAAILAASPWALTGDRRLILQPMTHAEKLRAYLLENGMTIIGETLSQEGHRLYQTICAEPCADAPTRNLSPAELHVGLLEHYTDPDQRAILAELTLRTMQTEQHARDARRAAGQDTPLQDELIRSLEEMLAHVQSLDSKGESL